MGLKETDVKHRKNEGLTAVHWACDGTGESLDAVKMILESGRIPPSEIQEYLDLRTAVNGETAMDIARRKEKHDICKYLEKF